MTRTISATKRFTITNQACFLLAALAIPSSAIAQSNTDLPPIVVQSAKTKNAPVATPKKAAAPKKVKLPQSPPATTAVTVEPSAAIDGVRAANHTNDPGTEGFVATQSSAATKSGSAVLATPRSVSTITRAELEERNPETVYEALRFSAGVNANQYSGGFLTREQALIRGFLAYQYLDGIKLHDSNWGIEPYGLERVDILKGPASMLYGQGSPGGLVDLTSKRPTTEPFREVFIQAGSREKMAAGFDFGGPIGDAGSVLTYRLTGMGRMADGEIDFTKNERAYLAPSFAFRPSSDTILTVLASYQYDPNINVQQPLPFAGTSIPGANGKYISRKLFLGEPGYHDSSKESYKIGYELRHRFDDVFSFEQNAAYRHIDISVKEVQGQGAAQSATATRRQMFLADYIINSYQVDNRLRAKFATGPVRHNVMVGADYAAIPNYQGAGTNAAGFYPLDLYNPVYGQALGNNPIRQKRYQDLRQFGTYVQDEMSLGDLTVTLGARKDWADLDQRTRVLNPLTGQFSDPPVVPKEDEAFTRQLGAIYAFSNGLAPFASYSESFFPQTGTDWSGNAFEPTRGEQSEVGIKYMPPGLNALITASVFDLTQQNVLTADIAHPGFATQTGEVRSKGFEIEGRATLFSNFNVAAAYTYLDNVVTKTNTVGGVGKSPVGRAEHQASLWGSYKFDEGYLAGLTLGGGIRYFGEAYGDALNTFQVPSFTLYDAVVRYDLGQISSAYENWELTFNSRNITDERYVGNCDNANQCYYGAGRSFDATLRMRF